MKVIALRRMLPIAGVVSLLLTLGSCKGRTAENMEPAGDTVEVTGLIPASDAPETPIRSTDSIPD